MMDDCHFVSHLMAQEVARSILLIFGHEIEVVNVLRVNGVSALYQ